MNKFLKALKIKETQAFRQYQLSVSVGIIRVFAIIFGVFNLLLLIPDFINVQDPTARLYVGIFRGVTVIVAFILFVGVKRAKKFNKVCLAVSACEILNVIVFCHVFYFYETPSFLIQLMGLFIIILAFFIVPNRWSNMLGVSILAAAGFVFCSFLSFVSIEQSQLIVGVVYLGVEILLCAIFSRYFYRYQQSEYATKTELERIYATDPLTQIGNRVRLEDEAEKWIEFCNRYCLDLSLVLIDVDNLKHVNDRYGHLIGDVILYELAQIMYTQLRKNDVCTRWGGDEFVLLLPSTSAEEAESITERIQQEISEKDFNIDIHITCSCGITNMKKGDDLQQLICQADTSMYMAKKQGRNNIKTHIRSIQNI